MNERAPAAQVRRSSRWCASAFTGLLVVMIGNISFELAHRPTPPTFEDVQGLLVNDDVKIAGVTLGRVERHRPRAAAGGHASSSASRDDVAVPEDSTIAVRWRNVTGLRYLYVEPGARASRSPPGHVFPRDQTRSPADLGSLLQRLDAVHRGARRPSCRTRCSRRCRGAGRATRTRSATSSARAASSPQTIAVRDAEIESLLTQLGHRARRVRRPRAAAARPARLASPRSSATLARTQRRARLGHRGHRGRAGGTRVAWSTPTAPRSRLHDRRARGPHRRARRDRPRTSSAVLETSPARRSSATT